MDAPLHDAGPGSLSSDLIRLEVTVPLDGEAAFALLVRELEVAPEVGGPWPHGTVSLSDPPRRLRLTWDGADGSSHVDVVVAEVDDDLTTVIVEHRGLQHHDRDERTWLTGEDGWWAILRAYAAAARA